MKLVSVSQVGSGNVLSLFPGELHIFYTAVFLQIWTKQNLHFCKSALTLQSVSANWCSALLHAWYRNHAYFCFIMCYYQRVGRLSMQGRCKHAIYAILKQKLNKFTTNTLKTAKCKSVQQRKYNFLYSFFVQTATLFNNDISRMV